MRRELASRTGWAVSTPSISTGRTVVDLNNMLSGWYRLRISRTPPSTFQWAKLRQVLGGLQPFQWLGPARESTQAPNSYLDAPGFPDADVL